MLKATEIKQGSVYTYTHKNESKISHIVGISMGIVGMENGDEIPFKLFMENADLYIDNDNTNNNINEQQENNFMDNLPDELKNIVVAPERFMKMDKNNVPILMTEEEIQKNNGNNDGFPIRNQPIKQEPINPVKGLIIKAKKQKQIIKLELELELVPKELLDVIKNNFDKEDAENAIKDMISTIDQKYFNNELEKALNIHYQIEDANK